MAAAATAASALPALAIESQFETSPSGLRVLKVRSGEGDRPRPGDTVVVYWTGVTSGYRQHRIDDPQVKDREPFVFRLGANEAIPAFEEAVGAMRVGDVVRIEVEGKHPELGYPPERRRRFRDDRFLVYSLGPQPTDLGGQRALDFVLDSKVLQDFNKNLVFDIRLLSVRRS